MPILAELAEYFGLYYSRISRIVKKRRGEKERPLCHGSAAPNMPNPSARASTASGCLMLTPLKSPVAPRQSYSTAVVTAATVMAASR